MAGEVEVEVEVEGVLGLEEAGEEEHEVVELTQEAKERRV